MNRRFCAVSFLLLMYGLTARGGIAGGQTQPQQNTSKSLSDAVKKSDWEKVRQLIAAGTGLGFRDSSNVSPLFLLANAGPDELVKSAIEAGADVNVQDKRGWTPLMAAVAIGDVSSVQHLIGAGAKPNLKDKFGQTALFLASAFLRDDIVRILIDAGADVNATDNTGSSPLLYALTYGESIMLVSGLDFDARQMIMEPIRELEYDPNPAGLSFLELDRAQTIRLLLDAGARTDVRPKSGKSLFELAGKSRGLLPFAFLKRQSEDPALPSLPRTVLGGDIEKVQAELALTTEPAVQLTAFRIAVGLGNADLIKIIHTALPAKHKGEALHDGCLLAAVEGSVASFRALRELGANINWETDITPFRAAIFGGHLNLVKFLVDEHAYSGSFDLPVVVAADRGFSELVLFLSKAGKDPLAIICTTLEHPAERVRTAAIDALKSSGFKVSTRSPFLVFGRMPEKMGLWVKKGGEEISVYVLKLGASQSQVVINSVSPARVLGVKEWKQQILTEIEKRLRAPA